MNTRRDEGFAPLALGLTGAEAEAWVVRYRGHARRYAWVFFAVVVIGIGSLVRYELGEFSQEWAMATGFAGGVTWILAW